MTTDRLGFTFASLMGLGPQLAVETAQRAEQLGYRSFWTAETTGPEAFSVLAAAGAAAPSLDLGTGVLALQLRTPMVVAMGAATLQALQPERDVLIGRLLGRVLHGQGVPARRPSRGPEAEGRHRRAQPSHAPDGR